MQTSFTEAQLADPSFAASEGVIRKCVHCGFCTATCPTYVLLGDELDSPRGRIYLMKEMLGSDEPPSATVVKHIDRCLSCLSCMTTCPSDVNYMHLVDHARAFIEQRFRRPWDERLVRMILAWVLPSPRRFRMALMLAGFVRPLAPLLGRSARLRPLAAMLALAPDRRPSPAPRAQRPVRAPVRRVALLKGCVEPALRPEYRAATLRLLARVGVEAVLVEEEGCCGALVHHLGRDEAAKDAARRNVTAWIKQVEQNGIDAVVVTASGCGTMIKDYGFLLRDDPQFAEPAARLSALACDISELLAGLNLPAGDGHGMRIAYHPACSLQHGQKIGDTPHRLLEAMGFAVSVPAEAHLCCGSAGSYNLLQPEIAGRLGNRKALAIERLNADAIALGNVGCAVQLSGRVSAPIVHIVELIDWATGGPPPAGLSPLNQSISDRREDP